MIESFMRIALAEARKGIGRTSPNPCVGAVIVKNGEVVGKGYHKKAGTPHAEINALKNCKLKHLVQGATLFVTLEPCSHTGKTPPCCEAIAEAGIKKVVIGMTDPNPLVNGKGIKYLENVGINVVSGVLKEQCERINYPFIKYITTGLPWIIMKAGVSLDGKLNYQRGQSGWITGEESKKQVHKLRDQVDAILVGRNTVEIDNPSLTTRLEGRTGINPVRIIVDSDLSLNPALHVFSLDPHTQTWLVCAKDADMTKKARFDQLGIKTITVDRQEDGLDLRQMLSKLGKLKVCSILVEGGAQIHGSFLREQLIDYVYLFSAPVFAGDKGVSLVGGYSVSQRVYAHRLKDVSYKQLGEDVQISGQIVYAAP